MKFNVIAIKKTSYDTTCRSLDEKQPSNALFLTNVFTDKNIPVVSSCTKSKYQTVGDVKKKFKEWLKLPAYRVKTQWADSVEGAVLEPIPGKTNYEALNAVKFKALRTDKYDRVISIEETDEYWRREKLNSWNAGWGSHTWEDWMANAPALTKEHEWIRGMSHQILNIYSFFLLDKNAYDHVMQRFNGLKDTDPYPFFEVPDEHGVYKTVKFIEANDPTKFCECSQTYDLPADKQIHFEISDDRLKKALKNDDLVASLNSQGVVPVTIELSSYWRQRFGSDKPNDGHYHYLTCLHFDTKGWRESIDVKIDFSNGHELDIEIIDNDAQRVSSFSGLVDRAELVCIHCSAPRAPLAAWFGTGRYDSDKTSLTPGISFEMIRLFYKELLERDFFNIMLDICPISKHCSYSDDEETTGTICKELNTRMFLDDAKYIPKLLAKTGKSKTATFENDGNLAVDDSKDNSIVAKILAKSKHIKVDDRKTPSLGSKILKKGTH